MRTKSSLRAGVFVLCASCAVLARAEQLTDPLGLAPTEAALPAKAEKKAKVPTPVLAAPAEPAAPAASAPAQALSQAQVNPKPANPSAPLPAPAAASVAAPMPAQPQSVAVQAVTATAFERPIYSQTTGATFRQLDQLRTQNALLAEKVKAAELQAKLSNQGNSNGIGAGAGAGVGGVSAASTVGQRGVQILSIYGLDDKLTAVVSHGNGNTFKVHEGSTIPGLGKVKSVSRDEVIVATKTGTISLEMAPISAFPGVR